MAVYAAHLTRTLQGAPSVFQVVAQEALGATVKPAFGKLIEYLATVYPDRLGWCERWYDELFLLFEGFLQYHYLKHYAASFSESFYGLVRAPTSPSGEFHSGTRLPRGAELGSLALLVLLPYLRDKFESAVTRWRDEHEDGILGKGHTATAKRAAIHVYSTIHLVTSLAKLVQLAAYLRGASSPTPALAALRLTLREAPPQEQEDTWGDVVRSLVSGQFGSACVTFPMLGTLALRGVEYGAFAVQFLRWWETAAPSTATRAAVCPPPPQRDPALERWRNKCPICLQHWKTPTALPVSGLIFCYSCISRHLRAHRACPCTRAPAREADLVRMYID
ncbi:peroxisome assembly protein 12 [Cydia strobilella]|uniref:peroxisome assembly protein 12 n=1 Tax=Cydia strobilella TaxID=1100964 RepID=UPI003005261E